MLTRIVNVPGAELMVVPSAKEEPVAEEQVQVVSAVIQMVSAVEVHVAEVAVSDNV
jgi:hypothetical protein